MTEKDKKLNYSQDLKFLIYRNLRSFFIAFPNENHKKRCLALIRYGIIAFQMKWSENNRLNKAQTRAFKKKGDVYAKIHDVR